MNIRPKLFIGSSGKNVEVATGLHRALQDQLEVTVWTQEVFEPSGFPIDTLLREIRNRDFAAFVFGLDDQIADQGGKEEQWTTRDNVLIETGMALSVLGRDKVFIVVPKSRRRDLRIPSDLHGMTLLLWDDGRSDNNIRAAVDGVASEMLQSMAEVMKDPDWIPGEHKKIVEGYLNSISILPHPLKTAAIPIGENAFHRWNEQIEDLQNDGLIISHGEDIALTELLVDSAESYTLVWRKATDPYDKEIGWAGGWIRFLQRIAKREELTRKCIFLLSEEERQKFNDRVKNMEEALRDLRFEIYHADVAEVENELSAPLPVTNDFEIFGEEVFKIIEPAGTTYRSQEGVRLVLKDLGSEHKLRRLTRYVFEAAGCE